MSPISKRLKIWAWGTMLLLLTATSSMAFETCSTAAEMEANTRAALERAASQYTQMAASGDVSSLRQNSIASLATNFGGVENAISQNKSNFSGAQPSTRASYLLEAPGNAPLERAEFFCGVFNSPERVAFAIPNLPPGHYGLVIEDLQGSQAPSVLTLILQQEQGRWKLAGFYPRATQIGGHDGKWFVEKARAYRAKGENHNAWFYYVLAWNVQAPVDFMSTTQLDKLADEMQQVRPSDLPGSSPMTLTAGSQTYRVTQLFPTAVGNDLDLVVKYEAADISNSGQTFQNNMALIKALVTRYPEYREAFAAVVARAVDPRGQDYGSLQAMKEIK